MRDSKNILHAKLGVSPMERQYGGGLDAAYMNRRRSSAFADPDATSAFASPMSMGGLPTIYRFYGGDVYSNEQLAEAEGISVNERGGFDPFQEPVTSQGGLWEPKPAEEINRELMQKEKEEKANRSAINQLYHMQRYGRVGQRQDDRGLRTGPTAPIDNRSYNFDFPPAFPAASNPPSTPIKDSSPPIDENLLDEKLGDLSRPDFNRIWDSLQNKMTGIQSNKFSRGTVSLDNTVREAQAAAKEILDGPMSTRKTGGGLPTIYREDGGGFWSGLEDMVSDEESSYTDAANYFGVSDEGSSSTNVASPPSMTIDPGSEDRGDTDAGGYGLSATTAGLLGLQRADPNQPNIGFEAYFNTDGKDGSAYDVGMPASPSKLDPIRNILNKAFPNVFDKPSGPAFVVGKEVEDRRGAYNAAMEGYRARGLPPEQYDSWFSKNAGNLMEGYRRGGDVFQHHANKVTTDASNKFTSTLESNKNLESNKDKTDEEIAKETAQELFGPIEDAKSDYPIFAPGGSLAALSNAIGKAIGKIGTVTINGVKMEVNKDGTLREETSVPTNVDYGSDAPDEKGTPKTEKDVELVNDLKKKSVMGELLRKEKKKRVDPNIQIIMDIYGLTFEEAQRFLGNEGVGTGGAGEFEGI